MQVAAQARLLDAAAGLVIAAGLLLLAATMLAATTSRPGTVAVIVLCLGLFGLAFGVALSVGAALTLGEAGEAAGTASSLSGCLQVGAAGLGSLLANLTHRGSAIPLSLVLLLAGLVALGAVRRLDRRSAVEG
jgi:DHA1 family bicyclomycin/chloramphenicol resistance-like MFS transporter